MYFSASDSSCIFVLLAFEHRLFRDWFCAHMVTWEIYLWVSRCHQSVQALGEKFSSEMQGYIFSASSWPAESIYRNILWLQMFLQLYRGKILLPGKRSPMDFTSSEAFACSLLSRAVSFIVCTCIYLQIWILPFWCRDSDLSLQMEETTASILCLGICCMLGLGQSALSS